jgi:hypothetical protein
MRDEIVITTYDEFVCENATSIYHKRCEMSRKKSRRRLRGAWSLVRDTKATRRKSKEIAKTILCMGYEGSCMMI